LSNFKITTENFKHQSQKEDEKQIKHHILNHQFLDHDDAYDDCDDPDEDGDRHIYHL